MPRSLTLVSALLALTPSARPQEGPTTDPAPADAPRFGHSAHGAAYDEGPRQRPWPIRCGSAPCPITTSHPEVQQWFDQANALLHSFWFYEAERALRWCVKLDPDCAMAYLWLARLENDDRDRSRAFLEQAVAKKHLVSERERRYIEAWEKHFVPSLTLEKPGRTDWRGRAEGLAEELEKIVLDYPDDQEAKLLYALNSLWDSGRLAVDAVLRQVQATHPDHPGVHHYLIHNWDDMELAAHALDSCEVYGGIAPDVGHANHMPGHIYSKLGMWHEAAIWLDSATRVEKAYMQRQLVLPFHNWNYAHNRNFLAHAQAMLGLPTAALQGARDLVNAPLDPDGNDPKGGYSAFGQGLQAMWRTLVRFERWDEILTEGSIPWRDRPMDKVWRAYAEGLAHLGRGDAAAAERQLVALRALAEVDGVNARSFGVAKKELEARLWLARGDLTKGLDLLREAAAAEAAWRPQDNDPPTYPRCLYNVLGETYLGLDSPRLAQAAFEQALEALPNNGWSWAGLARAHAALGDRDRASEAYGHMLHVWSDAEPGIAQAVAAHALGLAAAPQDPSPRPQRSYARTALDPLGPNRWEPYAAPTLEARDAGGAPVRLADFAGTNVLLVFYLSDQCVHCVEQLQAIRKRASDFASRDTVLLAISSDPPERNAAGDLQDLADAGVRLLSDDAEHHNAIRFRSYDEFEDLELHSTMLIDRRGRVRWVRTGGAPFVDLEFLLTELDRIEAIERSGRLEAVGAAHAR